ncbi:MAG: ABC transporter permease [Gemmatimonadales bacterium]|nr:ABC transporter permease [Gemmatimonadales bacterium]
MTTALRTFLRRVLHVLRPRRFEADLQDELRFHEAMAADEARHAGASPEEASAAARRRLGNQAQLGEASRAVWEFSWLEGLLRDLRYARRALRHRPAFAFASIVTLALGIGATTAFWSVLDPVLLRPLPYRESGRLMALLEKRHTRPAGQTVISPANALNWRDRSRALQDVALYTWSSATLADDPAEELVGRAVSTNMFAILDAAPALGRGFVAEDTVRGAPRALVISHPLWQRRFAGDPAIVGRPVRLREGPAVVVGVMPQGFRFLGDESYWVPFPMRSELRVPRGRWVMAIGRLAPGATPSGASTELAAIARDLGREFPDFNTGWSALAVPLAEQVTGGARPVLWLLAGAIGFVLLVACANVANLHLGQAIARRGELALRAALGASRGQVIRQWLVEGLVLATLGGVLGVAVAAAGVRMLVAAQIAQIPRLDEVGVDLRVLAFAGLVTGLAGLIFGLAPAVVVRDGKLRGVLNGRGGDPNPKAGGLRGSLVAAQVALSFVLLTGAGLTIRSLRHVLAQAPGIDAAGAITFAVNLPDRDYPEAPQRTAFYRELVRRIAGHPQVKVVGLSTSLPLRAIQPATSFAVVGEPAPAPGQEPVTQVNQVSGEYFAAMGIPVLRGRTFGPEDRADGLHSVVVSSVFAELVAPGGAVIGRHVKVSWDDPDSAFTIVGVVGDVRTDGLDAESRPSLYFSLDQYQSGSANVIVRAVGDLTALGPALRGDVAAIDRGLPVTDLATLADRVHDSVAGRRYPMQLLSLLGGLALILASVGLYGVLAYGVTQRHRELGVRRAIGATDGSIIRLVLRGGLRYVGVGLVFGFTGALLAAQWLGDLLYGVAPTDPLTLAATGAAIVGVSVLASWIPARRAARVDPAIVLRGDG